MPEPVEEPKTSPKEKNVDSSLSENSSSPGAIPHQRQQQKTVSPRGESPQAQPSHNPDLKESSPHAGIDAVPNAHIAALVDTLTESKSMNSAPTDDNIEDFVRLLKPNEAVVSYPDRLKAESLRRQITKLLADEGIEMPPLLFFKHCLKHTDALIADGKLETRPTSPNFFLTGHRDPKPLNTALTSDEARTAPQPRKPRPMRGFKGNVNELSLQLRKNEG